MVTIQFMKQNNKANPLFSKRFAWPVVCLAMLMTQHVVLSPAGTLAQSTDSAAEKTVADKTATEKTATTQPVPSPAAMPHIRINREKKWVDIDAKVVLRDGKWIELLVCTPGSREYESILTTEAKPSHIHLALLILGLKPGSPITWERNGDDVTPIAPNGPDIEISIHYLKEGKPFEIPAGQWIMDRKTNAPLPSSTWLFAGSKFMAMEGRPIYTADVNGSCISLVNFGDDLLTRPTNQTNHNDDGQLAANTKLIPQVGTTVVIRLTPVEPKAESKTDPKNEPATSQPAGQVGEE